jgi:hypothetical protein
MTVYAYKTNKLTFQQMRLLEHSKFVPIIEKGGWHLSYFGDINFIITKIGEYYIIKGNINETIKTHF